MAFLDNIFDSSNYSGVLGRLLGYPNPQLGASEGFPDSMGSYGGVNYPIYGQPEAQDLSAQSVQPQAQYAPQQRAAQPQYGPVDALFNFSDHLRNRGIITSLAGALTGRPATPAIKPTDDIREFEYARQQGFKGSFPDWLQRKRAGSELSKTPIYGTDENGNTVLLQLSSGGTDVIQPKLPPGVKVSSGIEKIDLGTEWGLYDKRTGLMVGKQPKDLAGAAEQKAIGAGQGEAKERQISLESKMPGLERVISQLDNLSEKATYTLGGQALDQAMRQLNMEPREASVARKEYEAVVNNQIIPLLRDTFGPQFTDREGIRLQKTLGDPDISPKEKQAVLRAFIDQKRRDVEALQRRNAGTSAPQQTAPQAAPRTAINPKTGQRIMLDPASNQWVPMR